MASDQSMTERRVYTRAELLDALRLEPCHVTGMHNPDHHLKHVCDIQRSAAFNRVLELIGIDESELPHALHGSDCYWCHGVPSQEEYRERNRKTFKWANVPVPAALAEPAPDHPKFDVSERKVLSAVRRAGKRTPDGWVGRGSTMEEALDLPRHSGKYQRPLSRLIDEGKLEERVINNLYHVRVI